jgi:hypothetical protein
MHGIEHCSWRNINLLQNPGSIKGTSRALYTSYTRATRVLKKKVLVLNLVTSTPQRIRRLVRPRDLLYLLHYLAKCNLPQRSQA